MRIQLGKNDGLFTSAPEERRLRFRSGMGRERIIWQTGCFHSLFRSRGTSAESHATQPGRTTWGDPRTVSDKAGAICRGRSSILPQLSCIGEVNGSTHVSLRQKEDHDQARNVSEFRFSSSHISLVDRGSGPGRLLERNSTPSHALVLYIPRRKAQMSVRSIAHGPIEFEELGDVIRRTKVDHPIAPVWDPRGDWKFDGLVVAPQGVRRTGWVWPVGWFLTVPFSEPAVLGCHAGLVPSGGPALTMVRDGAVGVFISLADGVYHRASEEVGDYKWKECDVSNERVDSLAGLPSNQRERSGKRKVDHRVEGSSETSCSNQCAADDGGTEGEAKDHRYHCVFRFEEETKEDGERVVVY